MAQVNESIRLPSLLRDAVQELSEFIALGGRVAFGLMTVNHATPSENLAAKITITHLFQIIGVSNVLKELLEVGSRIKDPILPLFNSNGVQDAMSCVQSFRFALECYETILSKSDNYISTTLMGPLAVAEKVDSEWRLVDPFPQLNSCLQKLTLLVGVGRSEQIQRKSFGDRSPMETYELQRLVLATKNLLQKKELSSENTLQNPSGARIYQSTLPLYAAPNPSFNSPGIRSIKELQHPRGFRGRYGEPDYPFQDKRPFVQLEPPEPWLEFKKSFEESELERHNSSLQGKNPNMTMFGCWPPASIGKNTVQERQIQSIFKDNEKPTPNLVRETTEKPMEKPTGEDTKKRSTIEREDSVETQAEFEVLSHSDAAFNTPSSTRDSTPRVPANENPAQIEATEAPSTEATSVEESESSETVSKSGEQTPVAKSFKPSERVEGFDDEVLEACILSPRVENVFNAIEWSSKVERLPLSQSQIQAQLDRLSPEYSVVDTISTLSPEEWRSIADYTKPRGTLLSVEKSHKVTMPTKFGSFDIASLIFIVKIEHPPTNPKEGLFGFRNPFAASTPGLFGNPPPQNESTSLFEAGNIERQRSGGLFGTRTTGGLFGNPHPATQQTGLFGTANPEGQTRPNLFGASNGGLFGTSRPQSTGLFGTTHTGAQTGFGGFSSGTMGGAFGGFQPTTQTSSLFNNTTPAAQTGFGTTTTGTRPFGTCITNSFSTNTTGNQTGTGLFGGFQKSQNEPQPSLFSGFTQRQTVPQQSTFSSAEPTTTQRPSLFSGFGSGLQTQTQTQTQPSSSFPTPVGQKEQTQTSAASSLFSDMGTQTQTSIPAFSNFWSKVRDQAQPPTSLFSNRESQAQPPSLFPSTASKPQHSSLFEQSANQTRTSSSPFGQSTNQTQSSSSLFGQPANQTRTSSSPFGQSTNQPQSSSSLFGQPANQTRTSSSPFGQSTNQPQSSSSLFGQSAKQTQTSSSPFGQSSSSLFGQSSSSLFGQPANQTRTSSSLFGQSTNQTQSSTPLFGQPANQTRTSSSPFGQSTNQTQSPSLFGQQTTQTKATLSLFPTLATQQQTQEQTQPQTQPSPSPFATLTGSAFGTTAQSHQQPAPSHFGTGNNALADTPTAAGPSTASDSGFRFGSSSTWRKDDVVELTRKWTVQMNAEDRTEEENEKNYDHELDVVNERENEDECGKDVEDEVEEAEEVNARKLSIEESAEDD